ncbi:hypothetical protein DEO72_LG7g1092 [Vigna unguiculata]|uniref:Uncharacterized protein n=1 Tax=Vigna unguiculata TaxID=3917 RepID=A0A4D6MII9_VIGUN|nr:hypothetical protein DEO72_LG7g1092 [Vigna unguiculata]
MGQSPKGKPRSSPCRSCNGIITSLLSTIVPRIRSHLQVDDHRKRENHTTEHTTTKAIHYDLTRLIRIHITWSDSADAFTCGGYLCSPPSCSPPSYVLQCYNKSISLTTRMQPYLESLPSYTDGAPLWTPTNKGHGITSRPLKRNPGADAFTCGGYLCSPPSCSPPSYVLQCYNKSISLTTRMQPYLESLPSYTDGAPLWTPTNKGHGITSRPLKRNPGGSRSSEPPSPRRGLKKHPEINVRSRLVVPGFPLFHLKVLYPVVVSLLSLLQLLQAHSIRGSQFVKAFLVLLHVTDVIARQARQRSTEWRLECR